MAELDSHYARLLEYGFIVLRQAVHSGDKDWVQLEIDLLHNLPSLIGETNIERHRCFWFVERELYIERVSMPGREQLKSRMLTYYEPIWLEMEPVLRKLFERGQTFSAQPFSATFDQPTDLPTAKLN